MRNDELLVPEGRWGVALSALIGRRQLRSMMRSGLPDGLREPFEFLLERRTASGDYGPIDRVEALRADIARRQGQLATFAAGRRDATALEGRTRPDELRPPVRSMSDTAHISSVSAVWGVFLYLCAKGSRARTIVELGTAAGISGCYLASAPSCRRFITVEGDPGRATLASAHLSQIVGPCDVINASFDAALDRVLPGLHDGIDMVFIDGDKRRGSYVALVDRLSERLVPGALIVFDDIQWADVQEDWRTLQARPGMSFVVTAGRFGVCVWDPSAARPRPFTLYGLGGIDVYRLRRDMAAHLGRFRGSVAQ